MFKSSSDQLIVPLRETAMGRVFSQFENGNQIIFDSAVGINVSLFIYVLVVWLPERGKRQRIRRNLEIQFDAFKEECICIFLSILKMPCDSDKISHLKGRSQFRDFFKEPSEISGQTRWDVVTNGLDSLNLNRLAVEFEILRDELRFTMKVIDVDHPEAFASLKRLAHILYRQQHVMTDYDDVKQLAQFLWSIHTGWSWVTGYQEQDVFLQTIDSI